VADDLRVILEATTGLGRPRRILVEGGSCLIGRGEFCDVQIADADAPLAHSEVHIEHGAIWIEAVDEPDLEINGRSCRRLALRDGDAIKLGDTLIAIRINPADELTTGVDGLTEDLSQLSALELCDRIETEQAAVVDYERRRLAGWDALLTQLETIIAQEPAGALQQEARIEAVLAQLHEVSSLLADRTRELAAQESEFLESAGELKQSQDQIASRLEHLLEQFPVGELRASA
jgi:predicted component of type VI protein secretion system